MKQFNVPVLTILFCLFISDLSAQAPQLMNYQGVARHSDGTTIVNQEVDLRISIISAQDIDRPVYTETHSITTNSFGLFSLKIGSGEEVYGSMDSIEWASAEHFITTEMDVDQVGQFTLMGTSQLVSVPYAFYAEKSGIAETTVDGTGRAIDFPGSNGQTIRHNGTDWEASSGLYHSSAGNIGIGTTTPTSELDVDGDINIAQNRVLRIAGNQVISTKGQRNMFIGDGTGNYVTSGQDNTAIGFKAAEQLSEGTFNTIIGFKAAQNMSTARSNTIIGREAGKNSTGNQNVLIGREAGKNAEGSENTFIGDKAGLGNTTGTSNTLIGKNANVGLDNLTNATAIGAGAFVSQSNSLILGQNARVGIGTSQPLADLHVDGAGYFSDSVIMGKLIPTYIEDWTQSTGTPGQALTIAGGGELLWATGGAGATGPTGPAGANGTHGATGATGPQGVAGADGSAGAQGIQGVAGNDGADGADGATGVQGPTGPAGSLTCSSIITGPATFNAVANTIVLADEGNGLITVMLPIGAPGDEIVIKSLSPMGSGVAPAGITVLPAGADVIEDPQLLSPFGIGMAVNFIGGIMNETYKWHFCDYNGVGMWMIASDYRSGGATGPSGATGPQGVAGADGATGAQGIQGVAGNDGADGADGATGAQGPTGPAGSLTCSSIITGPATFNAVANTIVLADEGNGLITVMLPMGTPGDEIVIKSLSPMGSGVAPAGITVLPAGADVIEDPRLIDPFGTGMAVSFIGGIMNETYKWHFCDYNGVGMWMIASDYRSGGATGPTGATGAQGIAGVAGAAGATGPQGATGPAGPLVSATTGQTLRHDGASWVASSAITNNGTDVNVSGQLKIGTTALDANSKLKVVHNGRYAGHFTSSNESEHTHVLHAEYTGSPADATAIYANSNPSNGFGYGIKAEGGYYGIESIAAAGDFFGNAFAVSGYAGGTDGQRYGVYGSAAGTADVNYGVYGEAGNATTNWAGYFVGDVYSTGSYYPSDRKLKQNIETVDNAMELINKLNVHSYKYRTDKYGFMNLQEGERFGFIADELKEVFPQFVKATTQAANPTDKESTKVVAFEAVNYTELVPILVKAIQEQNETINENSAMREQISANSAAKPSSSAWTVASDARLKPDIRKFEDGLDLIEKINPVWFTYNGTADMPNETAVGTIAQELQKVAPYMVSTWEHTDDKGTETEYLGVDYGAMDFVLINAIKELTERVEALEEENRQLRNK